MFFFSSRRRHTRCSRDWSSDVCSSDMHTSTSPQYSMIASLDVARKQAVMEGYKLLSRTLALSRELRAQINSTGVFRVLELDQLLPEEVRRDNIRLDQTKVTVDVSTCGYTVEDLH